MMAVFCAIGVVLGIAGVVYMGGRPVPPGAVLRAGEES
ncbi:hypothetical protein B0296_0869 [Bifidobacterium longum subsp. longum]|nr:hypothetical protein B0296_0869 [Bifidobacterium longum subsp. longum]